MVVLWDYNSAEKSLLCGDNMAIIRLSAQGFIREDVGMHVNKPIALTGWHIQVCIICDTWWEIIMPPAYELHKLYLYFGVDTCFLEVKLVKQHTATHAVVSCILCSLCLLSASRGHMKAQIYTIKVWITQSMMLAQQNRHQRTWWNTTCL